MDLLTEFNRIAKAYHLHSRQVNCLVAVSGGVDSIVLTELCKQADLNFSICHCNFMLRGDESAQDEIFVRSLGEKYKVEVFIKQFDTTSYASENKLSIQEAARKLRYDYFSQLRSEKNFAYTLMAHHANDQIETVLMNFFRGTGLDGLTGMPNHNKEQACLRPLLNVKRKDIESFAIEKNLSWRDDSSNLSSKYTRNFFRNELIPQLQTVFPQVEDNLLNTVNRFSQINQLYNLLVNELKKKVVELKGNELRIPILKLLQYKDSSLIYEIIKEYGFHEKQVDEVIKLASADSGKYIANEKFQIIKHRNWFVIAPNEAPSNTIIIDEDNAQVLLPNGKLEIKKFTTEKFAINKSASLALLDAKGIKFPLLVRKWKQGDYFYPLGMQKKKKVSRFFIDQKLSKSKKENVWVIESNKKILWVVGHRIDDRFKITDKTKSILQLNWSSL